MYMHVHEAKEVGKIAAAAYHFKPTARLKVIAWP